jgi:hypothetical protein
MNRFAKAAILLAVVFTGFPICAFANMSYSPWVHEIVQNGADMEVTVSVFEETTETNDQGEPLPGFEAAYTLERLSHENYKVVFEDRVFKPEEADEVSEYTCQSWNSEPYGADRSYYDCVDCDGDGTEECNSFCGVAYH